ncbi:hypothetical protein, partial [Buttiauxella noackiae]|uniref:hypothetical protein n=1 Tax=Buttiauxella noackiae TaxID=82992 RepID=UPI0028CFF81B
GTTTQYLRKVKRTVKSAKAAQQPELPWLVGPVKNSPNTKRNKNSQIRVVPDMQLSTGIGVISYLERIDGKAMYYPDGLKIGGVDIIKKWLSSDGRLYFIPPENISPASTVLFDNKESLQLEYDISLSEGNIQYIDSLLEQVGILNDFTSSYKVEGIDEFNREFTNGYLRYWKSLDNLMDRGLTIDEQNYALLKLS